MINIIKNICKILFKRKAFLITTFLLPLALSFMFMSINTDTVNWPLAVINNDNGKLGDVLVDRLSEVEGVRIINIDKSEDFKQKLSFHDYEMVIELDEDFTDKVLNGEDDPIGMYAINQNDYSGILQSIMENEVQSLSDIAANVDVNDNNVDEIVKEYNDNKPELNYSVKNRRVNIRNTFPMMIYIISVACSTICEYTLEDEKNNTKSRIIMSKVSEKGYLGAQCITYFVLASIPAIEYFILCKIGNMDIGIENEYLLFIILFAAVLLGVVFNMLLTSLFKKKQVYTLLSNTVLIPIFMISGAFWDFDFMNSTLQSVGNMLPIRWIIIALENLQNGEGIVSIVPMIGGVVLLSVILFLLSIVFTKNKIVLVKDN